MPSYACWSECQDVQPLALSSLSSLLAPPASQLHSIVPDSGRLMLDLRCLSECQDAQLPALSSLSSLLAHPASQLHSIVPDSGRLMPGSPCWSEWRDAQLHFSPDLFLTVPCIEPLLQYIFRHCKGNLQSSEPDQYSYPVVW